MKIIKRWVKRILFVALLYVVYVFSIAVLFYSVYQPALGERHEPITPTFFGESIGVDRVMLVEERMFSAITRLQMIEAAEESIQIAYYAVHQGLSSDLFYGALFEAAERGVLIELLLDGVFHNFYGDERITFEALSQHPNITIRFYEPIHWLKPWTFNNRLHDKFILVDGLYAMIGGRNIGDQYFLESYEGGLVKDRDVLILNTDEPSSTHSVLSSFEQYFETLFDHAYVRERTFRLSSRRSRQVDERTQFLMRQLAVVREEFPYYFEDDFDWMSDSLPTQKVTFIHNPLRRLPHEPEVLWTLGQLMREAQTSVWLQSPYIIPSRAMRQTFNLEVEAEVYGLTNSFSSSPNLLAMAGYWKHRDRVAQEIDYLYEYQGPGSIHAKSYLIDGRLSLVGSFNLDARSAFLSTESMVVIDSEPFATLLGEKMMALVEDSHPVDVPGPMWPEFLETPQRTPWQKLLIIRLLGVMFYPFDALL